MTKQFENIGNSIYFPQLTDANSGTAFGASYLKSRNGYNLVRGIKERPWSLTKTALALSALVFVSTLLAPPVLADAARSQARTGSFGNTSKATNNYHLSNSANTRNQRLPRVPITGLGGLSRIYGAIGRNGLPPTTMDSFVTNAGGLKDMIYGDEGTSGPPPFSEFTQENRIENGIRGGRAAGLTTGHGSSLPNAWGGDEFCKPEPFSQAGSSYGGKPWIGAASTGASPGAGNSSITELIDADHSTGIVPGFDGDARGVGGGEHGTGIGRGGVPGFDGDVRGASGDVAESGF